MVYIWGGIFIGGPRGGLERRRAREDGKAGKTLAEAAQGRQDPFAARPVAARPAVAALFHVAKQAHQLVVHKQHCKPAPLCITRCKDTTRPPKGIRERGIYT